MKHKKYLSEIQNVKELLNCSEIVTMPKIFYLAVDKRNQLHLNGNHMVTEYMLVKFILDNVHNDRINLQRVIDLIFGLETKVEYIELGDTIQLCIDEKSTVNIDDCDLSFNYDLY